MKMKKEHYEMIKAAMEKTMCKFEAEFKQVYKKHGFSKARYAWDLFYASLAYQPGAKYKNICNALYAYLDDTHINTALLRIVGDY